MNLGVFHVAITHLKSLYSDKICGGDKMVIMDADYMCQPVPPCANPVSDLDNGVAPDFIDYH